MRAPLFVLLIYLISAVSAVQADTLRCGTQLISLGDRTFEVERKCGPPVDRSFVGYTLGPYARQEMAIEEWLYGPSNGRITILRFEGNRLVRIESHRGN